ncbi:hypothetical protein KCU81_g277, partial [Aureobasidium melanogenum]
MTACNTSDASALRRNIVAGLFNRSRMGSSISAPECSKNEMTVLSESRKIATCSTLTTRFSSNRAECFSMNRASSRKAHVHVLDSGHLILLGVRMRVYANELLQCQHHKRMIRVPVTLGAIKISSRELFSTCTVSSCSAPKSATKMSHRARKASRFSTRLPVRSSRLVLLGTRPTVATSKRLLVVRPGPFILPRDIQEVPTNEAVSARGNETEPLVIECLRPSHMQK